MKIYVTSKNTGPSWSLDPLYMLYIGTSLEDAIEKVGSFTRYESNVYPRSFPKMYSMLPHNIDWSWEKWYSADGWWYSVVSFDLEENNETQG